MPKNKVNGPADHEEELADLQRRFDALGEPPPLPNLRRTPSLAALLSRLGHGLLSRLVAAAAQPLRNGRPTSTRRC